MRVNTTKQALTAVFLTAAGAVGAPAAQAALFTGSALFGPVDEDFELFDNLVTAGPVALGGGITLVSDIESTLGATAVDLLDNGTWGAGKHFAGIGDTSPFGFSPSYDGSMTFSFSNAFAAGAYLSIYQDLSDGDAVEILIEALGTGDAVLESYSVAVNFGDPFASNAGLFYGIQRQTGDILGLRISGDGFVLDDLRVAAVPVPAALPLMFGALGLLAACRRRA
jgi:hypothetical protein